MSILIDKDTSMLIIGITGKQGRIHCKHILDTGNKLLAGVAPGRGGQEVEGVPVFETVAEAREKFPEIEAAMLIVPKQFVRDAALQALREGIKLLVIITEFVPVMDALQIVHEDSGG